MTRNAGTGIQAKRLQLLFDYPGDEDMFQHLFASLADESVDGLIALTTLLDNSLQATIARLASEARLPSITGLWEFVKFGGLIYYGTDKSDLYRRAASYVDKILKGADPAELPIEQPMKFDFVINLKTARELGLTLPPAIMIQATEFIE